MPRESTKFEYDYQTLVELTGLTYENIRQHRSRGMFDPESLASIFVYLSRWAHQELRQAALEYSMDLSGKKPNTAAEALRTAKKRHARSQQTT